MLGIFSFFCYKWSLITEWPSLDFFSSEFTKTQNNAGWMLKNARVIKGSVSAFCLQLFDCAVAPSIQDFTKLIFGPPIWASNVPADRRCILPKGKGSLPLKNSLVLCAFSNWSSRQRESVFCHWIPLLSNVAILTETRGSGWSSAASSSAMISKCQQSAHPVHARIFTLSSSWRNRLPLCRTLSLRWHLGREYIFFWDGTLAVISFNVDNLERPPWLSVHYFHICWSNCCTMPFRADH